MSTCNCSRPDRNCEKCRTSSYKEANFNRYKPYIGRSTWDYVIETDMGNPTEEEKQAIMDNGFYGKEISNTTINLLNKGQSYREVAPKRTFVLRFRAEDGNYVFRFKTLDKLIEKAKGYPGYKRSESEWVDDDGRSFRVEGATYDDIFGKQRDDRYGNIVNDIIKEARWINADYSDRDKIPQEQIIGTRAGYYTNAGLDMGQYDETRHATVTVYLEKDEVMALAEGSSYGAQPDKQKKETKSFGPISKVNISEVERYTDSWLQSWGVLKDAKRGWAAVESRRRTTLKKLIELKKQPQL